MTWTCLHRFRILHPGSKIPDPSSGKLTPKCRFLHDRCRIQNPMADTGCRIPESASHTPKMNQLLHTQGIQLQTSFKPTAHHRNQHHTNFLAEPEQSGTNLASAIWHQSGFGGDLARGKIGPTWKRTHLGNIISTEGAHR